ncbi:hypothetical protein K1T71_013388 [Dendrolimus kikuchii]|uniref:Uncharacterized protein n=1 Tax=Dendrolimus kikuchii TaxID=765133 RepID=A0ACC1CIC5_9NEOP|nr:hypothetical protein K1T71_013388 [Dendrolimus kikuchii]
MKIKALGIYGSKVWCGEDLSNLDIGLLQGTGLLPNVGAIFHIESTEADLNNCDIYTNHLNLRGTVPHERINLTAVTQLHREPLVMNAALDFSFSVRSVKPTVSSVQPDRSDGQTGFSKTPFKIEITIAKFQNWMDFMCRALVIVVRHKVARVGMKLQRQTLVSGDTSEDEIGHSYLSTLVSVAKIMEQNLPF